MSVWLLCGVDLQLWLAGLLTLGKLRRGLLKREVPRKCKCRRCELRVSWCARHPTCSPECTCDAGGPSFGTPCLLEGEEKTLDRAFEAFEL